MQTQANSNLMNKLSPVTEHVDQNTNVIRKVAGFLYLLLCHLLSYAMSSWPKTVDIFWVCILWLEGRKWGKYSKGT